MRDDWAGADQSEGVQVGNPEHLLLLLLSTQPGQSSQLPETQNGVGGGGGAVRNGPRGGRKGNQPGAAGQRGVRQTVQVAGHRGQSQVSGVRKGLAHFEGEQGVLPGQSAAVLLQVADALGVQRRRAVRGQDEAVAGGRAQQSTAGHQRVRLFVLQQLRSGVQVQEVLSQVERDQPSSDRLLLEEPRECARLLPRHHLHRLPGHQLVQLLCQEEDQDRLRLVPAHRVVRHPAVPNNACCLPGGLQVQQPADQPDRLDQLRQQQQGVQLRVLLLRASLGGAAGQPRHPVPHLHAE